MVKTSFVALLLFCVAIGAMPAAALELEDCRISAGPGYPGIKARCGTFSRPLNPANPDGEQLDLRVAVVPALDLNPEPDPLVPLATGALLEQQRQLDVLVRREHGHQVVELEDVLRAPRLPDRRRHR